MSANFRAAAFNYESQEDPRFAADPVQEAFEAWQAEQSDAEFADNCRDFFDSLKYVAGELVTSSDFVTSKGLGTVKVDGWASFNAWQFDNRFPGAKA